jgi:hypothetical protein
MCVRQMRPPGRGDFWILKIAHAPSPKNLSKNGFCPRKGVAFLQKALLHKNFSGAGLHAQGTGGVVGQASEAIGASSLRASDLDARHNTCTSLKKLYQELSPHCVPRSCEVAVILSRRARLLRLWVVGAEHLLVDG